MPSLRAAAACALMAALATGYGLGTAPPVDASSSCTGWASTVTPPSHINVFRTALGRVDTVPFRRYVEIVMAAEWGPENPSAALAAGAVAVKQYAWYFAMEGNWRGGSVGGRCYDVRDSTADQVYRPASKRPTQRHLAAVAESWAVTLRKPGGRAGSFFATHYNNGDAYRRCGSGLTGHTLRQIGASACASAGYTFREILRLYYGPGARIVTTGGHDLDGTGPGDIGVLVDREAIGAADEPTTDALVLASNGRGVETRSDQALGFSLGSLLGHATVDVTGDGRPDLAVLETSGEGPRISVFPSRADGFGPAVTWWESGGLGPALARARVRLVAGPWDRGKPADLGLVVQYRDGGRPTQIYELRATDGVRQATLAWEGDPGGIVWDAYGEDFTGDGRPDVALVVDTGPDGTRFMVLAGSGSHGSLKAPRRWASDTKLARADTFPLAADVDGDGRSDVVLVERDDAGLRFSAYHSTGRRFEHEDLGRVAGAFPWPGLLIGASDLNGDTLDDVYVLLPDGEGARVEAFLSRGRSLSPASWGSDADLDLASAAAY